jgi:hypothetical protein
MLMKRKQKIPKAPMLSLCNLDLKCVVSQKEDNKTLLDLFRNLIYMI